MRHVVPLCYARPSMTVVSLCSLCHTFFSHHVMSGGEQPVLPRGVESPHEKPMFASWRCVSRCPKILSQCLRSGQSGTWSNRRLPMSGGLPVGSCLHIFLFGLSSCYVSLFHARVFDAFRKLARLKHLGQALQ